MLHNFDHKLPIYMALVTILLEYLAVHTFPWATAYNLAVLFVY